jgi:7-carboxy-7-deazaguanine synthase
MKTSAGARISRGYVSEIFASRQGEGLTVGEPQIFVRFAGCNLNCTYCDTRYARKKSAGERVSVAEVIARVDALRKGRHRTVSVTGGEPLMQAGFLRGLLSALKARGFRILLETNGYYVKELASVIGLCDIVSMDIKLIAQCGRDIFERHMGFLKTAGNKAYVKVVIDRRADMREARERLSALLKKFPRVPVVFQPATEKGAPVRVRDREIRRLKNDLLRTGADARVIAQHHIRWGIK